MKILNVGLGAAGNKIVVDAVNAGAIKEEDAILINSTPKDFPADFKGQKIIIGSSTNGGSGKERNIAKAYLANAIKENVFDKIDMSSYTTVAIYSSTEGGTGSGSAPTLASYVSKVLVKNVHLIAVLGFYEDTRSLANTIEFFKEVDDKIIVHAISNQAFLDAANGNRAKAERLANQEIIKQYKVWSGQLLIPGDQNIDIS